MVNFTATCEKVLGLFITTKAVPGPFSVDVMYLLAVLFVHEVCTCTHIAHSVIDIKDDLLQTMQVMTILWKGTLQVNTMTNIALM